MRKQRWAGLQAFAGLATPDASVAMLQHGALLLDSLVERGRNLGPREQIDPERKVAFLEGLSQLLYLLSLVRRWEGNQVEVGVAPGVAGYARAIGPDGHTGLEQRTDDAKMFRREINVLVRVRGCAGPRGHSHLVPVKA